MESEHISWRGTGFLASFFSYVAFHFYSQVSSPVYSLNPSLLNALNCGNIFSFCFMLTYVTYYISLATVKAEEKLDIEYKRTNAALMERNRALTQLQGELNEASEYVKTMLPKPIRDGSVRTEWHYIPSTSLGGDAFGYHWIDNDNFAIYLIDVSGHGVGAALLSVTVMNVLHTHALAETDFLDPEQVLRALNDMFPGEEHNDMFFTIWYGIYNKPSRKLTYASGGHPPALLFAGVSGEKSAMTPLRTPNYVIGGVPDSTYQKAFQTIEPLSYLYIFSDGVYEHSKPDGSMWRFKDFLEFMNQPRTDAESKIDYLFYHAKELTKTDTFYDDFTILEVAFE